MLSISVIRSNRYPAIYVASYVGRKSEVKEVDREILKCYEFCYQFVE